MVIQHSLMADKEYFLFCCTVMAISIDANVNVFTRLSACMVLDFINQYSVKTKALLAGKVLYCQRLNNDKLHFKNTKQILIFV